MARGSFDGRPFLLGLDVLEALAERAAQNGAESYPPFNFEAGPNDTYALSLAVAGFTRDELEITVEAGEILTIIGDAGPTRPEREYLYRGIAKRRFRRVFALAHGLEATGASLRRGILRIALRRRPREDGVRKIAIDTPSNDG